jgi:hypothetical protein
MKVALLGAGRIGRLHGTVMASQPEVDEVDGRPLAAGRSRSEHRPVRPMDA